MSLRIIWIAALCGFHLTALPSQAAEPPPEPKPGTFFVIPHTHWEGAVFKTREEYLEMGLPNILKAMRLLREQPGYRYTLDQVAYVKPFLERFPAEEADFRRYLAEGRLQLVGALDVMPDVNMPGGETFVRQMQYGKGYYRDKLGVNVTTAWMLDNFGQHAQLPQLLTQAGYKTFWFVRGVPKQSHPAEFFWEGIDGTRIPAFYLAHSYALMYPTPRSEDGFRAFANARFNALNPNTRSMDRVGVSAADVSEPEDHQVARVEAFNREGKAPFVLKMAVPADYEAAVARRTDRPVWKGELNPIFQGIYSSRIELKSWMRTLERDLLTAEKLGVLAGWLGAPPDEEATWRAWEPLLFNETHDLASGVMTDHVYEDTIRGYEFSGRLARDMIDERWETVTSKMDTLGTGTPVVAFNTLGWTRSDVAQIDLGFGRGGVLGITLRDDQGQPVPAQILESTRYADSGLKTARVAFIARDVPAMGYRTYHAVPSRDAAATKTEASTRFLLENEFSRLTLDPTTGAITSLRQKPDEWDVFAGHGNVIARQDDHGDLWEPYHGLDGGSRVAMTTKEAVPVAGKAVLSDAVAGKPGIVRNGAVLSEFRVANALDSGKFATLVRLYSGLRRIEIETKLVNHEKFVRYRALFPTTIKDGKNVHEIPFGAIVRPNAVEFPAQNWVDHSDGRRGLAVLNIGLPGNVATDGTLMVSLLRAHTLGAYGFGGGYEPGMSSETGLQLGKERTLRYALVPHNGDWRDAGIFREGLEFNHPLLCRQVAPHPGPLPKRWGLLDVSAPNVVVSSLKPGKEGTGLLRVYEAAGKSTAAVSIQLHAELLSANETNLMEVGSPGTELEFAL